MAAPASSSCCEVGAFGAGGREVVPGRQPGPGAAACAELLKKKALDCLLSIFKAEFPFYKAGKGADVQQVLHVAYYLEDRAGDCSGQGMWGVERARGLAPGPTLCPCPAGTAWWSLIHEKGLHHSTEMVPNQKPLVVFKEDHSCGLKAAPSAIWLL